LKTLEKISKYAAKFASVLSGCLIIAVFIVIFIGIIGRFISRSPSWTEEISRWGLLAICFSGTSAALYQRQHTGMNIFIEWVPLKFAKVLTVIAYVLAIILCAYCFYFCGRAAFKVARMKGDIIPLSMMYVKLFLPMGFALMIIQLVNGLVHVFSATDIANVTISK